MEQYNLLEHLHDLDLLLVPLSYEKLPHVQPVLTINDLSLGPNIYFGNIFESKTPN
jgi:hypothetical protein